MSQQGLSFFFKIETIQARDDAPRESFAYGFYKPPIRIDHCERTGSTGWHRWTMDDISPISAPQSSPRSYSTSVFWDGVNTNRFLFHPKDCQRVNISDIEDKAAGERFGWQHLLFTHQVDTAHSVLDLSGEHETLSGRPGSYSPHFLPTCYQSLENATPCGLSGDMGLFLALAAFSCRPELMMHAIRHRLNIRQRRWLNGNIPNWGNGSDVSLK